ncbi:hypothetical protein [Paenibacillus larvae]|uniref:Secreted protein n=1 Tax=Paenibacillus larvae subsp. larvae TaxID=147375 RepID=A0A6C0QLW0_9BACL|nr:hypothetical protein [Paenibacillus larvae]QHZ49714.1 hypothetical protein ERICV_00525 [Paenibacillus larvae subsp. larvae]
MNKNIKITCATLALAMGLTVITPSVSAFAAEKQMTQTIYLEPELDHVVNLGGEEGYKLLEQIESIPDEIINTNDANQINAYLKEKNIDFTVKSDRVKRGWRGCSLAIAGAIVTTAIPIAKLAKIKSLVNALGGVKEAAKIIWGATTKGEKWKALGEAGKDLVAELAGITAVKTACF